MKRTIGVIAVLIAAVAVYLISGIRSDAERAKIACIELCKVELAKGRNLSAGPCLSNQIIEDWVCDVAHKPRIEIDNLPENQCEAYRNRTAHHFVEIDPNCNFIRAF